MAGLLGFLAAGVAQGAGNGIVAEARAKREAAISELESGRLMQREQADRDFRAGEGAKDRAFRASEGERERASRASEIAADREFRATEARLGRSQMLTGADGKTVIFDGDRTRPLMDQNGEPVTLMPSAEGDAPSEVRTAEWLVRQGIAASPDEAWGMVRTAREGTTTPADIETMVEKAVDTELGGSMMPPTRDAVEESRTRNRQRILKNLGLLEEAPEAGAQGAPAPARPEGMSDTQVIEQAKAAIAQGAPAAAVRQRLVTMGIDPAGAGL